MKCPVSLRHTTCFMPYSRYTILLADDDPDDRLLFTQALADLSIQQKPIVVTDGEQLVSYLNQAIVLPDLLFLDINMPLKDGLSALAEIKANRSLTSIPTIMLSTTGNPHTVQRAYDLGANLYACKPTGYAHLVSLLQKILSLDIGGLLKNRTRERFLIKT